MPTVQLPTDINIPDDERSKLLTAGFTAVNLAVISDMPVPTVRFLLRRYKRRPSMWEGLEPVRLQFEKWKQPRYHLGDLLFLLLITQLQKLFPTLKQVDQALEGFAEAREKHGDEALWYGCFLFTRDERIPYLFFKQNEMDKVQPCLKILAETGIAALMFFPIAVQMEMSGRLACWYAHVDFYEYRRRKLAQSNDEQFKEEIRALYGSSFAEKAVV
jgi:hypothetical protein